MNLEYGNRSQDTNTLLRQEADNQTLFRDVVSTIQSGGIVHWKKLPSEVYGMLVKNAVNELGLPPFTLERQDFLKPFGFLQTDTGESHSLEGLYTAASRQIRDRSKDAVTFILKRAGIETTVEDCIAASKLEKKQKRKGSWHRVPDDVICDFLDTVGEETGKRFFDFTRRDYRDQTYARLDGHTLIGLFPYLYDRARNQGIAIENIWQRRFRPIPIYKMKKRTPQDRAHEEEWGKSYRTLGQKKHDIDPFIKRFGRLLSDPSRPQEDKTIFTSMLEGVPPQTLAMELGLPESEVEKRFRSMQKSINEPTEV